MSRNILQWVVGGVIIVVIAGAFFHFRDRLSGSASDLQVGDCFAVPDAEEVTDIQHSPCTESHTGEVFFVGNLPDGETAPAESVVESYVQENCDPAYQTYTGRAFADDLDYSMSWYYPTFSSWEDGDREVTCFIVRTDGGAMTESVRAAQ